MNTTLVTLMQGVEKGRPETVFWSAVSVQHQCTCIDSRWSLGNYSLKMFLPQNSGKEKYWSQYGICTYIWIVVVQYFMLTLTAVCWTLLFCKLLSFINATVLIGMTSTFGKGLLFTLYLIALLFKDKDS